MEYIFAMYCGRSGVGDYDERIGMSLFDKSSKDCRFTLL